MLNFKDGDILLLRKMPNYKQGLLTNGCTGGCIRAQRKVYG